MVGREEFRGGGRADRRDRIMHTSRRTQFAEVCYAICGVCRALPSASGVCVAVDVSPNNRLCFRVTIANEGASSVRSAVYLTHIALGTRRRALV